MVRTPDGEGTVLEANPISGILKVRAEGSILAPKFYHRDECQYLVRRQEGPQGPQARRPGRAARHGAGSPCRPRGGEERGRMSGR